MNKLLQTWFDTSLQGVAFIKPVRNSQREITEFRYRMVNAAFARILRKSKEQLVDQVVKKVFDPAQEKEFFRILVAVIETGKTKRLLKHYHIDGEDIWHDITLSPMDDQLMVNVQDVSEQEKTEHELERRFSMESIVSRISSRLINLNALEMESYIPEALEEISEHIGAERASVFLYTDDYKRVNCVHEWCASDVASQKSTLQYVVIRQDDWFVQQLKSRQIIRLNVDELPNGAIYEEKVLAKMAVQSMILVPLILSGETQGFVGFYTISRPRVWDQNDVSLLETFTTMIANLLQRLRQEAAIVRANQRLEGLHDIDQALLNYRMVDQSPLLIAMKYLHFMVPCNRIIVFQFTEPTGLAVATCRVDEGKLDMYPGLSVPASFIHRPFDVGSQMLYHPDLQPDSAGVTSQLRVYEQGFRSLIIIHLYNRTECIGAFALASKTPFFFSEEYRQIAQELASPLAIILHQQRLYEQLKHYTEQLEKRVEERTREIRQLSNLHQTMLESAGQAILSCDIEGVIETANRASFLLLGYQDDELIGRVIRLEVGLDKQPAKVVFYESKEHAGTSHLFYDLITAHGGSLRFECEAIGKNGQPAPVLLATSSLLDDDGNIIGFVGIATDISALKMAETKLKKTNQELSTIFNGAIDLHCIADSEGKFLNVNQAWVQTLGYSAEELCLLNLWDLLVADDTELVRQQIQALTTNELLRNQTNSFRKKDDSLCVLEWNAVKIDHLIYASARDITERQQAEIQLRGLNERLRMATHAAGQGIWEIDLINNCLIWDDRVWEIYGVAPRSNFTFQDFLAMVHPDDRQSFVERYQLDESGGDIISNVTRIVRPDGAVRYIRASGRIVRNKFGQAIRHLGVIWDVTAKKEAEKALEASEQRFRDIANNVDEVFWVHSAKPFQLLYINPAFERVWGTSSSQLREKPFFFIDSILKEDQPMVWELIDQYKAGQEGQSYFRLQVPDQPLRWLFVRTFIIRDAAGQIIRHIGIVSDVTSQKEKEIVLQQALQREQELNQLKSQFVSTASHEFRTPLATIQSSVDLIKLYLDLPALSSSASIQKHIAVIEKQINQFSGLLTDILTIGTIESGKVSFNPRWVDIVSICEEIIITHFSQPNDQRRVRLLLEGTPCPVFLDAKLINHVIVNLLSNAFKFSTTAPTLRIVFEDTCFIAQVIDEGIGIPARELSTLFQAFFRASNTTAIPGTGLGLVIARQFVELHGGHLTLQSEEKKGTTCTVTMPIACANEAAPIQLNDVLPSQHVLTNHR